MPKREGNYAASLSLLRHDVCDAFRELNRIDLRATQLLLNAIELAIFRLLVELLFAVLRPGASRALYVSQRRYQLETLRRLLVEGTMPGDYPLTLEMLDQHSKWLAPRHATRHRLLQRNVVLA